MSRMWGSEFHLHLDVGSSFEVLGLLSVDGNVTLLSGLLQFLSNTPLLLLITDVVTTAQVVETSVLRSPEDHTQSTYDMFTIIWKWRREGRQPIPLNSKLQRLVSWLWVEARLEVTLFCYKPWPAMCKSHIVAYRVILILRTSPWKQEGL